MAHPPQNHGSNLLENRDLEWLEPQVTDTTPLLPGLSSSNPDARPYASTQEPLNRYRRGKGKQRRRAIPDASTLESDEDRAIWQKPSKRGSTSKSRSRSAHSALTSPTLKSSINSEGWRSPPTAAGTPYPEPSCSAPQPQLEPRYSLLNNITLTLENSGSVARDHLASERTFLAYMRTSLAIASAGVALVQLFSAASTSAPHGSAHRLHLYIRPLGAGTVVVGLIVLFIGVIRYFTIQAALTKGYFPVARLATSLIATMLTVLVTLTFGILLAGKLEAKKN